MSPNEFDLRNALRDGEGNGDLDVDRIVAGAHAHRSQRRTRILSAGAAAVVVAAAAVGGAVLWGGNGDSGRQTAEHNANAGATASAQAPNANSTALPGGTAGASSGASSGSAGNPDVPLPATDGPAPARACPAQFPRTLLPGGGSPGQFGASGPMFAHPVATVLVCQYASSQPGRVGSATLTGSDATSLASSIENASTSKKAIACPDIVTADNQQLAIIAYTAGGTAMPTVTTDISIPDCNQPITNGTAVRYDWQPPAGLRTQLALLPSTNTIPRAVVPSGANGSPAR